MKNRLKKVIACAFAAMMVMGVSSTALAYSDSERNVGSFGKTSGFYLAKNADILFSTKRVKVASNVAGVLEMDQCIKADGSGYASISAKVYEYDRRYAYNFELSNPVKAYDESQKKGYGSFDKGGEGCTMHALFKE